MSLDQFVSIVNLQIEDAYILSNTGKLSILRRSPVIGSVPMKTGVLMRIEVPVKIVEFLRLRKEFTEAQEDSLITYYSILLLHS